MKNLFLLAVLFIGWTSCQTPTTPEDEPYGNPPAEGFNAAASDSEAIAIADKVMESMGGRKAWDETTVLEWNFFGRRKHYWNKSTGDIRIESAPDSTIYLMNINDMKGQIKQGETLITHPDTLNQFFMKSGIVRS